MYPTSVFLNRDFQTINWIWVANEIYNCLYFEYINDNREINITTYTVFEKIKSNESKMYSLFFFIGWTFFEVELTKKDQSTLKFTRMGEEKIKNYSRIPVFKLHIFMKERMKSRKKLFQEITNLFVKIHTWNFVLKTNNRI